jgi:hypothetical protein
MKIRLSQRIIGIILIGQILPTLLATAATHVVQVTETRWDEIKEFSDGLAGVCSNGQWGFIDTNGKIAIAVQGDWKYAYPFKDGLAQADVGGANFDFIDKNGQRLVGSGEGETNANVAWARMLSSSSQTRLSFSHRLIPIENKLGKWGFMNQKGQLVITPQWGSVLDFQEGLARVSNFDSTHHITKCGFINTNGQIVIPLQWEYASSFCEGMAVIMTNGLCGFINQSGEVVIAPQWNACQPFRNGFALAMKESPMGSFQYKFGIIDRSGKIISEPQFTGFMLGRAVVVFLHDKKGIIDKTGHVAGGLWWDSVKFSPMQSAVDGRDTIKIEKEKKFGLVDINGKIVVQPLWEDIGFSEAGFTPVKQNGKWGLLDGSGKLVIQPQWEAVNYPAMTEKIITAKENGKWGLFNMMGEVIAKPEWDTISGFSEGLAAVQAGNKWGLIDQSGKTICPPKWDWAEPPHDGLLRVREGEKWSLMRIVRD